MQLTNKKKIYIYGLTALRSAKGGANTMGTLNFWKVRNNNLWRKWNEEVQSEYTPVKQNECKKHEIDPMETGTSKAHTNSESFLYNEDNTKNNF